MVGKIAVAHIGSDAHTIRLNLDGVKGQAVDVDELSGCDDAVSNTNLQRLTSTPLLVTLRVNGEAR
ncbi:MAG: hypothetical protein WAM39_14955 [Bryobacteraceae bacterium]